MHKNNSSLTVQYINIHKNICNNTPSPKTADWIQYIVRQHL